MYTFNCVIPLSLDAEKEKEEEEALSDAIIEVVFNGKGTASAISVESSSRHALRSLITLTATAVSFEVSNISTTTKNDVTQSFADLSKISEDVGFILGYTVSISSVIVRGELKVETFFLHAHPTAAPTAQVGAAHILHDSVQMFDSVQTSVSAIVSFFVVFAAGILLFHVSRPLFLNAMNARLGNNEVEGTRTISVSNK